MISSPFWKKIGPVAIAVAVVGGAFGIGLYVGIQQATAKLNLVPQVVNKTVGKQTMVDFTPFWQAWSILDEKFVATQSGTVATTTDQAKLWGAIRGLAESYGDPYTTFFPPAETKSFQEEISGNFEGVGMELDIKDDILTVVSPIKNSPAYRAGIKAGDKVLKINDTVTTSMPIDKAVQMIRGEKGTEVRLTVLSTDSKAPREVSIIRDVIDIPTIETEKKDGVFIIRFYSFTGNSTVLFRNALQEFVDSKTNKLVIDLRGNPGGYLEASVDIASWFLPEDAIVVKEDSAGRGKDKTYKSSGYDIFNDNLKMAILVDGGSASASEILAGALRDHGIATLVGQKTFGKGSVQELISLTPDTALKITIARWLTPKGISISEQGLVPDVEVKAEAANVEKGIDDQLNKAIEILNK